MPDWPLGRRSGLVHQPDFAFDVGRVQIGFAGAHFFQGRLGNLMVAAFEMVQFLLGKFLHVQHHRVRRFCGADEFVELELHGYAVAVLGVLDEEQ